MKSKLGYTSHLSDYKATHNISTLFTGAYFEHTHTKKKKKKKKRFATTT